MARLQRRDDAFDAGEKLERLQRFGVHDRHVFDAARLVQPGMLRPDARIVQSGRDRVAVLDLAVLVLEQIGAVAVQHAGRAGRQRRAMLVARQAFAAGLDPNNSDVLVVEEGME